MSYQVYAEIRDRKGMKDFNVAKAAGFGPSTLCDWKKGRSKPKLEKLIRIAAALEVPITDLIKEE